MSKIISMCIGHTSLIHTRAHEKAQTRNNAMKWENIV